MVKYLNYNGLTLNTVVDKIYFKYKEGLKLLIDSKIVTFKGRPNGSRSFDRDSNNFYINLSDGGFKVETFDELLKTILGKGSDKTGDAPALRDYLILNKDLLNNLCAKVEGEKSDIDSIKKTKEPPYTDELHLSHHNDQERIIHPIQKIIFGPPGTGKSYSVDEKARELGVKEDSHIKKTFHPEFTYGDFVARLMPLTKDGKVEYKVVAGCFIKALASALSKPEEQVLLQIDEINRGNCASIFGDIFQLLDRGNDGASIYEVHLSELAKISLAQEMGSEVKINKIRIPKNLSIIATMNTSDESVYFMDSAFKRRWQFEYIDVNHNDHDQCDVVKAQNNAIVQEGINWNCLRRCVNNFIIDNSDKIRGIEDKQVGLWFVKAENGKIPEDDINFKLMHYLWDNVFAKEKKPLRLLLGGTEELASNKLATFGQFTSLKKYFIENLLEKYKESACEDL